MTREEKNASFEKVRTLADKKGLSLYRIASDLGFSRSFFSEWKKGRSMPKTDKMIMLADYFGVDIKELL